MGRPRPDTRAAGRGAGEPARHCRPGPGLDRRPRLRGASQGRAGGRGEGGARARDQGALGSAGAALGERQLRAPRRLPGDGRGRQGQRDRARDVGREPAGRPGRVVQAALVRGARPRLPVAHREGAAGARADRHLQPLALRGGRRAEGAPRVARAAAAAGRRSAASGSGRSATRTSTPSSATSTATARRSSSSSSTSRRRSRRSDSSRGSTRPTRSGSSMRPTSPSARAGTSTWPPSRTPDRDLDVLGALVRHSRRPQAAHPCPRRCDPRRHDPGARPAVATGVGGGARGQPRGPRRSSRPSRPAADRGQPAAEVVLLRRMQGRGGATTMPSTSRSIRRTPGEASPARA